MLFLQAIEGVLKGQKFVVPDMDRVIVGRYEIYDLVVPDPSISRKHFAIEKRGEDYYIVDLGSLNGTQLNGHRVSTAKLEENDSISAGQTVLAFHEGDGAAADSAKDEDIESLSDDDIILEPDAASASPATIPMPAASLPESSKEADDSGIEEVEVETEPPKKSAPREPAKTKRTSRKRSQKGKADKSAEKSSGRCAACGRKVTQEDIDTGDCAKTRLGFVCSRCIEKRQKSGEKGSLEKFITERQKRRR